jgi:hypothetical protein
MKSGGGFVINTESPTTSTFTPRYPNLTYGPPGTGKSWHEDTVEWRAKWNAEHVETEEEEEDAGEPVVLVWARNATDVELDTCPPILRLQKAAQSFGWETKIGYCKSLIEGTEYGPKAQKAGQSRPDVIQERLFILMRKQGKGTLEVTYLRKNEGKWVRDSGFIRGVLHMMGDAEVREYLKSD